jgi:hypothetical protein
VEIGCCVDQGSNMISVRLDSIANPLLPAVFARVLRNTPGVVNVDGGGTGSSTVIWQVQVENSDPFRLQADLLSMLHTVTVSNGQVIVNGVSCRYTPAETSLLAGICPAGTGVGEVRFMVGQSPARYQGTYPSGFD